MDRLHPGFTLAGRRFRVDLPHLGFATAIAGWVAWFCHDAWAAQPDLENMILIAPGTIFALAVYAAVAASCCHVVADGAPLERKPLAPGLGLKIAGNMVLLAGLVAAGAYIGFDVGAFAYLLLTLAFLGERRWWMLLLAPLVFTAVVMWCFATLLQTPLPMLLMDSGS